MVGAPVSCSGIFSVIVKRLCEAVRILSEYGDVLHSFHGHRPFSRVWGAVILQSVASLLVLDYRLGPLECDGVSVFNNLVYADQGYCTVVWGDLAFVVSDVD